MTKLINIPLPKIRLSLTHLRKLTFAEDILNNSRDTPLTTNIRHSKNSFLIVKHYKEIFGSGESHLSQRPPTSTSERTEKASPKAPIQLDNDISDDDTIPQSNVTVMHRQRYKVNVQVPDVAHGVMKHQNAVE